MEFLLMLIVLVLVLAVAWWAINAIAGAFGLPPQIVVVIQVLIVLLALAWLITRLGGARWGIFG